MCHSKCQSYSSNSIFHSSLKSWRIISLSFVVIVHIVIRFWISNAHIINVIIIFRKRRLITNFFFSLFIVWNIFSIMKYLPGLVFDALIFCRRPYNSTAKGQMNNWQAITVFLYLLNDHAMFPLSFKDDAISKMVCFKISCNKMGGIASSSNVYKKTFQSII